MNDTVPVPRDGFEAVIHGQRRIAIVLDLLKNRIGKPIHVGVARDQQHRQTIRMGDSGRDRGLVGDVQLYGDCAAVMTGDLLLQIL